VKAVLRVVELANSLAAMKELMLVAQTVAMMVVLRVE
jgi:hypothetical protein